MSARAGVLVTGTEVLTGRVRDRNGPWLSDRLAELGMDLAHTLIVGDRPEDLRSALRFMQREGLDLVITSGGLGPTADDLTAEIVGEAQGREMVLDEQLEGRIAEIVRPLAERYPQLDREAIALGTRKQATIPRGARVLGPVGTAPGLVVTPAQPELASTPSPQTVALAHASHAEDARAGRRTGPTIVVLPGPPRELQPMWEQALATEELRAAIAGATVYRQRVLRLFGIPESEIAETLRSAERDGIPLERLEITTCLRGGEIEVAVRYEPDAQDTYDRFERIVQERHPNAIYSMDGSTVDEQVASLLRGEHLHAPALGEGPLATNSANAEPSGANPAGGVGAVTIAVAESCTGGMLAARLTDPPGASEYVLGGVVAYSNDVKVSEVGVERELIERHGAVSGEVAQALAGGVRARLGSDIGVGVTGIAGPDGGTPQKPVGLVWLSVETPAGALTRSVTLPGGRIDVRERAVTVAMHMIRRALVGETDEQRSLQPAPHGSP